MRSFDKYIMFIAEQYETADDAVSADGTIPEIKLDMDDTEGKLSEEERIEKFEELEDILKALVEDEEEREELVQKIASAAGLEEEMGDEGEETHEGEPEGHKEGEESEEKSGNPFAKKKKAKKDEFSAFGSEADEAGK
ncbi:MAG: hypothetical protein WCP55_01310 [Lentisphaerota bacterium]